MYRLVFTDDARRGLKILHKKAPNAIKKLNALLEEIQLHPITVERDKLSDSNTMAKRRGRGESTMSIVLFIVCMRRRSKSLSFQYMAITNDLRVFGG